MNGTHVSNSGSTPGTVPVDRIEELLASLRGVISVKAVPNGEGELGRVHVLASDRVTVEQVKREVESTLLTYFDLPLESDQVSVAISRGSAPSPGGTSAAVRGEALSPGDTVAGGRGRDVTGGGGAAAGHRGTEGSRAKVSHGGREVPGSRGEASGSGREVPGSRANALPGGPQTPGRGPGASAGRGDASAGRGDPPAGGAEAPGGRAEAPGGRAGASAGGREAPDGRGGASASRGEDSLRPLERMAGSAPVPGPRTGAGPLSFVRYTVEGDLGPSVEIRVTLQARGEHYDGVAPAAELGQLEPVLFAEAAVHAAEIALRSVAGDAWRDVPGFRVEGAERFEALRDPYMAVAVSVSARRTRDTVTGFHPLSDSAHTAAVLAALDAVRRFLARDESRSREAGSGGMDPFTTWG